MGRDFRSDDSGTSIVEFVVVVVLVMIPIAYGVVVLSKLHSASSAVIVAAREATRAYVNADSPSQAGARADKAVELALGDHGLSDKHVIVRCTRGACLAPGSRVVIEVTTDVGLPLMPFGGNRGSIAVQSVHEATVDTFRNS